MTARASTGRPAARARARARTSTGVALLAVVTALVIAALSGCGVRAQPQPVPIDLGAPPEPPSPAPPSGSATVPVYFVRGGRLHEVVRPAQERSPSAALEQLLAGPAQAEVTAGTRTALLPQPFSAAPDPDGAPDTVVLAATADFANVSGRDQLLAVAQLVWTVTGTPGVDRVRFTVEGTSIEVPTDQGLRGDAVTRTDYASVAPVDRRAP